MKLSCAAVLLTASHTILWVKSWIVLGGSVYFLVNLNFEEEHSSRHLLIQGKKSLAFSPSLFLVTSHEIGSQHQWWRLQLPLMGIHTLVFSKHFMDEVLALKEDLAPTWNPYLPVAYPLIIPPNWSYGYRRGPSLTSGWKGTSVYIFFCYGLGVQILLLLKRAMTAFKHQSG